MTLPSPLVLINSQSQLPNGVNVSASTSVTVALAATTGVYAWNLECIGTDDLASAATLNASLVVNGAAFTATFNGGGSDGYAHSYIFRSQVNNGLDVNGLVQPSLTTTFGVYIPDSNGNRAAAQNETLEGDAVYGWVTKWNQNFRNIQTQLSQLNSTPIALPQRGLTYQLEASQGTTLVSSNVVEWRNQAPGKVGYAWVASTGAPLGTGINGHTTLEYNHSINSQGVINSFIYQSPSYSPSELSLAATFRYTGSANNSGTIVTTPAIICDNASANPPRGVGLVAGLNPGDSTKLQIIGYVSDSNGGSTQKQAQAVDVLASAAHYVVMTYSAATGKISLYVDGLAVVQTSGVGLATGLLGTSLPPAASVGVNGVSTSGNWNGSILNVAGWDVALTASEVAQAQTYLRHNSGLP